MTTHPRRAPRHPPPGFYAGRTLRSLLCRHGRGTRGALWPRPYGYPARDAHGRANSALLAARGRFADAREDLQGLLEELIETETRGVCATATGLTVEIYHDEMGEPRARLIDVVMSGPCGGQGAEPVAGRIGDLLDEWAITAPPDTTEIVFSPPSFSGFGWA